MRKDREFGLSKQSLSNYFFFSVCLWQWTIFLMWSTWLQWLSEVNVHNYNYMLKLHKGIVGIISSTSFCRTCAFEVIISLLIIRIGPSSIIWKQCKYCVLPSVTLMLLLATFNEVYIKLSEWIQIGLTFLPFSQWHSFWTFETRVHNRSSWLFGILVEYNFHILLRILHSLLQHSSTS